MLGILGEREQFSMGSRVAIAGTSLLTVIGLVVAACKGGSADTCTTDNYCNEQSGGLCLAESGKQECAYPDTSCPNGYRFSDGACVMDGFQHLTVQLSGDGAGTVSSSPAGLTCSGMTCTGTFQAGVSVSLSATATTGSFLGWSGDGCQGTNGCTVVLDQDQTVQALFGAPGQARWADMISSSTETNGQGMAVDSAGDLIVVGHFGGTLVQAPVTSTGLDDGYVAKLNHTDGTTSMSAGLTRAPSPSDPRRSHPLLVTEISTATLRSSAPTARRSGQCRSTTISTTRKSAQSPLLRTA